MSKSIHLCRKPAVLLPSSPAIQTQPRPPVSGWPGPRGAGRRPNRHPGRLQRPEIGVLARGGEILIAVLATARRIAATPPSRSVFRITAFVAAVQVKIDARYRGAENAQLFGGTGRRTGRQVNGLNDEPEHPAFDSSTVTDHAGAVGRHREGHRAAAKRPGAGRARFVPDASDDVERGPQNHEHHRRLLRRPGPVVGRGRRGLGSPGAGVTKFTIGMPACVDRPPCNEVGFVVRDVWSLESVIAEKTDLSKT